MDCPTRFTNRSICQLNQICVEQNRLDAPNGLPRHLHILLLREAFARLSRLVQHRRERIGAHVPLVEREVALPHDCRGNAGFRDEGLLVDDLRRGNLRFSNLRMAILRHEWEANHSQAGIL